VDDRQIEQLLRRHKPVGPPRRLRTRILVPTAPAPMWPWAVAVSIALGGTIAVQTLSGQILERIDLGAAADARQLAIEVLADILGGDATAWHLAEADLERTRLMRETAVVTVPLIGANTP
jgi:hypothetical protein